MSKIGKRLPAALLAVALAGLFAFAGADYREEFSKSVPLKAGETFVLANVNGKVSVSTWRESRVEIKAVKIARDAARDLKDVEIRVAESAGRVEVKAVWPKNRHDVHVSVNFEVRVPEDVNLKRVETVNGDVKVSGSFGAAVLGSTNGSVTAEGVRGALDAETTNGGIRVVGLEGRLAAETTNGSIRIEKLTFRDGVRAETTNGSIHLAFGSAGPVNATLRAETTNGHVSVDLPVTLKNLRRSRRMIEAQVGQGGPEIALCTTNGSILIGE
jgi:DUF4097 and DUF4098 domain-containing protein YvlB